MCLWECTFFAYEKVKLVPIRDMNIALMGRRGLAYGEVKFVLVRRVKIVLKGDRKFVFMGR